MTTTRKRPIHRCPMPWLLAGLVFSLAGTVGAQERDAVAGSCGADRELVGNIGIDVRCSDCLYHYDRGEDRWSWYFRAEPKITDVKRDGPSRGRLRSGDVIVALDGMLITTPRAGERMANLIPGRATEVTVRRNGRQVPYAVTPDPRCRKSNPSPTPPLAPVAATPAIGPLPPIPALVPKAPTPPLPPTSLTRSWFGFGLSCDECTLARIRGEDLEEARTRYVRAVRRHASASERAALRARVEALEEGGYRWTFHTPPRLYSVDPDGPADRAGLRRGDVLTHIDGVSLTSEAGGTRLAQVRPGQRVSLVYRRGDAVRTTSIRAAEPPDATSHALALSELARLQQSVGRIQSLSNEANVRTEAAALRAHLEALQAQSELQRGETERLRQDLLRSLVAPSREPVGVLRARPAPDVVEPVEGRVYPLRYSGVLQDVNVVVRSRGSVVVSRDEETGELVITTSDAVIRMKPEKVRR